MKEMLPHRHRLTVEEYYRMAEVGLLAPDARTELIQGEVMDMAPIGNPHMGVVDWLVERLVVTVGGRAVVRPQGAIRLGNYSMPQPDLAVLKRYSDYHYRSSFAHAADVLMVVEVSDTTLRYDRRIKVPLYAQHGIQEVWIVDVNVGQLHLFRSPEGARYAQTSSTDKPGVMEIPGLAGVRIDLSGLFAPQADRSSDI